MLFDFARTPLGSKKLKIWRCTHDGKLSRISTSQANRWWMGNLPKMFAGIYSPPWEPQWYDRAHMTTKRHKYPKEAPASSSKLAVVLNKNPSKENMQLQMVVIHRSVKCDFHLHQMTALNEFIFHSKFPNTLMKSKATAVNVLLPLAEELPKELKDASGIWVIRCFKQNIQ